MTAVFRDNLGYFTVENVESIQYEASEKKWIVFFKNGGCEEYEETQLETVSQE